LRVGKIAQDQRRSLRAVAASQGEGLIVDMVQELAGINPRYELRDAVEWSGEDRLQRDLDRMFAQMAAEPMSPSLKKMLIESKLLLPHR
jgi:hypothetical protein